MICLIGCLIDLGQGKYDVPAEISHALETTNQTKLSYVGFSMGTSMFWIMCSTRPEFSDKIRLMTALAPVVYINNMPGFPRLIAPFERIVFVSHYAVMYHAYISNSAGSSKRI